ATRHSFLRRTHQQALGGLVMVDGHLALREVQLDIRPLSALLGYRERHHPNRKGAVQVLTRLRRTLMLQRERAALESGLTLPVTTRRTLFVPRQGLGTGKGRVPFYEPRFAHALGA